MDNTDEEQIRLGRRTAIMSTLAELSAQAKRDMENTLENLDRLLASELPALHEHSVKCLRHLGANVSILENTLAAMSPLFYEVYSLRNISQLAFCRLQQLLDLRLSLMERAFSDEEYQDLFGYSYNDSWENIGTVVSFLHEFAGNLSLEEDDIESLTDSDVSSKEDRLVYGNTDLQSHESKVVGGKSLHQGDMTHNADEINSGGSRLNKDREYAVIREDDWDAMDQREVAEERDNLFETDEIQWFRLKELLLSSPEHVKIVQRLAVSTAFDKTCIQIFRKMYDDSIIVTHKGGISTSNVLRHVLPWVCMWESAITDAINGAEGNAISFGNGAPVQAVFDRFTICETLKQHREAWINLRSEVMKNLEDYCLQLSDLQHVDGNNLFARWLVGPPEEEQLKALGRLRDFLEGPTLYRPEETVQHFTRLAALPRRVTPVLQASLELTNYSDN